MKKAMSCTFQVLNQQTDFIIHKQITFPFSVLLESGRNSRLVVSAGLE